MNLFASDWGWKVRRDSWRPAILGWLPAIAILLGGCASQRAERAEEILVEDTAEKYVVRCRTALAADAVAAGHVGVFTGRDCPETDPSSHPGVWPITLGYGNTRRCGSVAAACSAWGERVFTLGTFDIGAAPGSGMDEGAEEESAAASAPCVAEGYWRKDIWHQMGHEAKDLVTLDFWRGFKVSYWKLENALVLTAAMGASVTIRESGVDDAIRRRTKGQDELGSMSETIQILGNPGTHFGGAGVLWLTSTLTENVREHEVAKSLADALAVNGVSTVVLKAATNTHAPDGEGYAWPSGHTSSTFCAAAVLNEYYGPWVGVPSFALAGLVGYQRIDSRVHDFSDVVFGGFMGYVIGASIAKDNKVELPEVLGMKVLPLVDPETGASGLALMKQW